MLITGVVLLTYLERQKCYGPNKTILFKKQLFDLVIDLLTFPVATATLPFEIKLNSKWKPNKNGTM
jgi:hypothetical protein